MSDEIPIHCSVVDGEKNPAVGLGYGLTLPEGVKERMTELRSVDLSGYDDGEVIETIAQN